MAPKPTQELAALTPTNAPQPETPTIYKITMLRHAARQGDAKATAALAGELLPDAGAAAPVATNITLAETAIELAPQAAKLSKTCWANVLALFTKATTNCEVAEPVPHKTLCVLDHALQAKNKIPCAKRAAEFLQVIHKTAVLLLGPERDWAATGTKLMEQGDHETALVVFLLLKTFTLSSNARFLIGSCLAAQHRHQDAIGVLKTALLYAEKKELAAIYLVLGDCLLEDREVAEAARCFQKVQGSNAEKMKALYKLGLIKAEAEKNPEEALRLFEEALLLKGKGVDALAGEVFFVRALLFAETLQDLQKAKDDLYSAIKHGKKGARERLRRLINGQHDAESSERHPRQASGDGENDPFRADEIFIEQSHPPQPGDYIGGADLMAYLNTHLAKLSDKNLTKTYGQDSPSSLLLWGPSGCGKTFAGRLAAGLMKTKLAIIGPSTIGSHWAFRTNLRLRSLFSYVAAAKKPLVLVFDECESFLGGDRRAAQDEHMMGLRAQFLLEIDKLLETSHVAHLLIFCSNYPDICELMLLRRVPWQMYIPPPSPAQCAAKLRHDFARFVCAEDLHGAIELVAGKGAWSFGELDQLSQKTLQLCLQDALKSHRVIPVSAKHLDGALHMAPSPTIVSRYIKDNRGLMEQFGKISRNIGFAQ